jgi:hypothetical protein
VSAQRIQKADVIAIRHIDTVGLLKLREEVTTIPRSRRSSFAPAAGESAPPPLAPTPIAPHAQTTRPGRGGVWTLALGLVLGVVIGQPGGLGLRSVGAAAHTEVADSIAAPAPVAEPAPAAAKPPELAQPAAPAQPARATARHHR